MDEIQKVLVDAGRKDLAQKYYKKVAIRGKKWDDMGKREKKKAIRDAAVDGFTDFLLEQFDAKESDYLDRMGDEIVSDINDIDPQEINKADIKKIFNKLSSELFKYISKIKL